MNTLAPERLLGLVLAVQLTSRGFAWMLFENAQTPVDWQLVHSKDRACISTRFEMLLERYEPNVVVLGAFDENTKRSKRIKGVYRELQRETEFRGIDTSIFDRDTVQTYFAQFGAQTRTEISKVIAEKLDDFSHRQPGPRKIGSAEDMRLALFDAAALALTYFACHGEA